MNEYRVSHRYAKALLETANLEGIADTIYQDFKTVDAVFKDSRDLRTMTESPVFQPWRKIKIYESIFSEIKISKLTLNFLLFLLDKRRGNLVISIINEFVNQYNIQKNRLKIHIESAVQITDSVKNDISTRIAEWTKKEILPEYSLKPEIMGGIKIYIDDWVYDASLKNQLEILHHKLAND